MQLFDIKERFSVSIGMFEEFEEELEHLSIKFIELAKYINANVGDSRESTIAIERLEESYMWAIKSMQNNPKPSLANSID